MRRLPFILGLCAIAAFGGVMAWLLLGEELPPQQLPGDRLEKPDRDAGTAAPSELRLSELNGEVEVKGADGSWRPAKQGDVLKPSDGVRTRDGSWAVLVGGEYWEVKMEAGTEVEVSELSSSISKLLLGSGMAHATVRGGGRHTFEVKAAKSDAAAKTTQGAFTISSNGEGTVAVGTQEGEVEFEGKGRVVIVRAGQRSVVLPGQAPSDPVMVPSSLLLKVQLPTSVVSNKPKLVVAGQTEPGVCVEFAGKMIRADATGRFEATYSMKEGPNALDIRAVSVGGVRAESHHQIDLDTQVRKVTIDPDLWGLKKKPPPKK